MKSSCKYFLYLLLFLAFGCHYHKANMTIQNETNKTICYATLAKDSDGTFYEISAGGEIDSYNSESPIIRGCSDGLKTDINSYSDKRIYVAFFNPEEQQYVFKNVDSMLSTGKLKVMKFTKKELDSLDWKITYTK
jgi:hypothetical protein